MVREESENEAAVETKFHDVVPVQIWRHVLKLYTELLYRT